MLEPHSNEPRNAHAPPAGRGSWAAKWLLNSLNAVLWGTGGLLLLASSAGFLGRWWWICDLASHFCWQYLAAGGAALVVAAITLRWRPGLLLLSSVAINVFLVYPFYAETPAGAARGDALRVLTLNVNARNRSQSAVLRTIAEADADVVLVVEYSGYWQTALESLEEQYPHCYQFPREGNFGMALYSRLPVRRCEAFALGRPAFVAVDASVEQGGREWELLGVHVIPPVSAAAAELRNNQFRELAERVHGRPPPVVVLGDLNCTAWSPHFRQLLQASGLRDSELGYGIQPTWPRSPFLRIPIDHCLVSPSVLVLRRRVVGPFGSDHCGIAADLAIRR